MASVFDGKNPSYALEKLSDFINNSGSGVALAPTSAEILVGALQELETKITEHNGDPEESMLPRALYAERQLQKFVNSQKSDIAGEMSARIYVQALRTYIKKMQDYEKEL